MTRPVRFKKGHLFEDCGSWFVKYNERVRQQGGAIKFVQTSKRLGSVVDYPTPEDIEPLRLDFMQRVHGRHSVPDANMTLTQFVECVYLPYSVGQHRPITTEGYQGIWENHIRERLGKFRVREVRTVHVSRMLRDIALEKDRAKNTLQRIKSVLSGIYTFAKNEGAFDGVNPVQDALIPSKSREQGETYAYDLHQILQILNVLPLVPKAVVATTSFAGLRKSELRGFRWTDYAGEELTVNQVIVKKVINRPKTRASHQTVPVIAELAKILKEYRTSMQNPDSGLVFQSKVGTPLSLDSLAWRKIRPAIKAIGLPWYGWHGFRRGVASNLYALGADEKVVQRILRHARPHVTKERYIKAFDPAVLGAMQKMQATVEEMKSHKKPDSRSADPDFSGGKFKKPNALEIVEE